LIAPEAWKLGGYQAWKLEGKRLGGKRLGSLEAMRLEG